MIPAEKRIEGLNFGPESLTGVRAAPHPAPGSSLSPRLYRFCRQLLRYTWAILHPVTVTGLENLPSRGPAIICPKHQRWEDILAVGLALPPPLYYIAKAELFTSPLVREFLRALGGVPLDRANPRATLSSFRQLLPLLRDGAYLVLFPEGTYVPGQVGPGRHRLIELLLKMQQRHGLKPLSFVPVGLTYRPRTVGLDIEVNVGTPLSAASAREALAFTEAIMREIATLSQTGP